MTDYFNHNYFVNEVIRETGLTPNEVQSIHEKYKDYGNQIYSIPFVLWMEPTPYQPIRLDPRRMRMYVPNKGKLVTKARDLIMRSIGPSLFVNGFFPLFTEVILKSALYLPTPKSFNRQSKYLAECKVLRPIVTPDTDNVEKILNDSIKSFLVFDDAQITSDITEKYYSIKPRMEVEIFYSANNVNLVHDKLIEHRKQKWIEMWNNGTTPVQLHLRRFSNISRKCI